MFFVGLNDGAMYYLLMYWCLNFVRYVNVFYLLLHEPRFPDQDRELCINITNFAPSIGKTRNLGQSEEVTGLFKFPLS